MYIKFKSFIYNILNSSLQIFYDYYLYVLNAKPNRKPTVFLFGVPFHSNLGDQAQTYCILKWIKEYLPRYQVCINMLTTSSKRRLNNIKRVFRKGDILLCHSGYHITDLYHEKDVYETIIRLFPEENVRIMPQTIFFKDKKNELACADVFNSHGKTTLLCRDELSYAKAQDTFSKCRLHLYPDIVTSLIGRFPLKTPTHREGILFCMRNDKEAYYSKDAIQKLKDNLSEKYSTTMSDTTVSLQADYIAANRHDVLSETFSDMARYRAVITDRYHGTIFSLIANTPVIVVSSSDHKLSSGVKWFPESFKNHVFYAKSLEEVPAIIEEIMNRPHPAPLPAYFDEMYYGKTLLTTLNLESYV